MEMSKRMSKRVVITHPIDPIQKRRGLSSRRLRDSRAKLLQCFWITVSGFMLEVVPEKTDSPPQGVGTHFKRVGIWNQQNWEDFVAYSSGDPEEYVEVYWSEEQRVHDIAEKDTKGKVKYHVPEMVWSHKFEETSTANIRTALGLKDAERGRRILSIIVFKKLDPITDLSEDEFLSAWWQIIRCHYALWECGVHHRDVSPSNLMVYRTSDGRYIGVLNDFDLSSTRDTPSGQERTGIVPFMAIELLTKEAIEGKVQHLYQHDAESFIWVFAWVCLRYEEGRLLRKGRPLDEWLKFDAFQCHGKKLGFLATHRHKMIPSQSHKNNWDIAMACLRIVYNSYGDDPSLRTLENKDAFEKWLETPVRSKLPPSLLNVRLESM
ncbi:hypothetical protein P692DRAFT_20828894 [Suillus brevipes Sb2]|nr:hypothetical protein P692DRAFT_20828894 [Suillus brevipes Sb2]